MNAFANCENFLGEFLEDNKGLMRKDSAEDSGHRDDEGRGKTEKASLTGLSRKNSTGSNLTSSRKNSVCKKDLSRKNSCSKNTDGGNLGTKNTWDDCNDEDDLVKLSGIADSNNDLKQLEALLGSITNKPADGNKNAGGRKYLSKRDYETTFN